MFEKIEFSRRFSDLFLNRKGDAMNEELLKSKKFSSMVFDDQCFYGEDSGFGAQFLKGLSRRRIIEINFINENFDELVGRELGSEDVYMFYNYAASVDFYFKYYLDKFLYGTHIVTDEEVSFIIYWDIFWDHMVFCGDSKLIEHYKHKFPECILSQQDK